MQPSPRSLILDLLSTLRRGAFPVGALVEAGSWFGLEGGSIRVALARLAESGLVEREGRGRYRLGPGAAAVQARVVQWPRLDERVRGWDGGWVGVQEGAGGERADRRRSARAARFLGLRVLVRGLQVRPDNLVGGIEAVRASLASLGLAPGALVFRMDQLDAVSEARARTLWDVGALLAGYRTQRARLERSERRLARLGPREARVESFLVGGRALQQLVLDPLLPEPIVPAAERDALLAAVRRYDQLGRACWAPFLEQHGVLTPRSPADTRGVALSTGGVA